MSKKISLVTEVVSPLFEVLGFSWIFFYHDQALHCPGIIENKGIIDIKHHKMYLWLKLVMSLHLYIVGI